MSEEKKDEIRPMRILSASDILAAKDLETRDVPVPEWGGIVRLQALTGKERDAFETKVIQLNKGAAVSDTRGLRSHLLSMCIVGEDGQPLFSDKDVSALDRKNGKVTSMLFDIAQELSGIGREAKDGLVKN